MKIETWSRLSAAVRDHLVERMHDRNQLGRPLFDSEMPRSELGLGTIDPLFAGKLPTLRQYLSGGGRGGPGPERKACLQQDADSFVAHVRALPASAQQRLARFHKSKSLSRLTECSSYVSHPFYQDTDRCQHDTPSDGHGNHMTRDSRVPVQFQRNKDQYRHCQFPADLADHLANRFRDRFDLNGHAMRHCRTGRVSL